MAMTINTDAAIHSRRPIDGYFPRGESMAPQADTGTWISVLPFHLQSPYFPAKSFERGRVVWWTYMAIVLRMQRDAHTQTHIDIQNSESFINEFS